MSVPIILNMLPKILKLDDIIRPNVFLIIAESRCFKISYDLLLYTVTFIVASTLMILFENS